MKGEASEHRHEARVGVIGAGGEFGRFLIQDIFPEFGARVLPGIERDTPPEVAAGIIAEADEVFVATSLAGYPERAALLVQSLRDRTTPLTVWLIPSVLEPTAEAARKALAEIDNPNITVVIAHPMYGPNGFRSTEKEARTFMNIMGEVLGVHGEHLDVWHQRRVQFLAKQFEGKFGIRTATEFTPAEHDRITAQSQGLSYCMAQRMFEGDALAHGLRELLPDAFASFEANKGLIETFMQQNKYMDEVRNVFDAEVADAQSVQEALAAFKRADEHLNGGVAPRIETKWYNVLCAAAGVVHVQEVREAA